MFGSDSSTVLLFPDDFSDFGYDISHVAHDITD